jgi:hypothetical protein
MRVAMDAVYAADSGPKMYNGKPNFAVFRWDSVANPASGHRARRARSVYTVRFRRTYALRAEM